MNVKRLLSVGVLGMFLVCMIGGVLGADVPTEGDVREFSSGIVNYVSALFGPLFGPLFGDKEILSRVFFALLLGMIIFTIVSPIFGTGKGKTAITWIITLAITSLALLGLPSGFLETIRTQYGAMGATILTIIPFMLVMIFTVKVGDFLIARLTWIFYAMYYFAMYAYKVYEAGGWFADKAAIPYMAAWVVGIFVFFGIGQIRKLMLKGELEGYKEVQEHNAAKLKAKFKLAKENIDTMAQGG